MYKNTMSRMTARILAILLDRRTVDRPAVHSIYVSAGLLVNGVPMMDLAVLAAVERVKAAKEEGSLFAVGVRTLDGR